MRKRIVWLTLFIIMLFPASALAATGSVSVSLPSFEVRLNGTEINNTYSQYPLIVYKDITYFPMTYDDCHFMGLETTWSREDGLGIEKNGIAAAYKGYETNRRNAARYQASIPTFKITVNGKVIDNAQEQYPLLIFRDITYFPLTWRFAVDEFNWDYHFDGSTGLAIQSGTSVQKLSFPTAAAGVNAEMIDGWLYYQAKDSDDKLNVYRSPIVDIGDEQKMCTLTVSSRFMPWVHFYKQDGVAYFSRSIGSSPIMSRREFYHVNEDGQAEIVLRGNVDFRMLETGMAIVSYYGLPCPENLYYQMNGQEDRKHLGNDTYTYGWTQYPEADGGGYTPYGDMHIVNKWVYIIGYEAFSENAVNKIYKINIETNETIQVSDVPASRFSIVGDHLYFTGMLDHKLYKKALQGSSEAVMIDTAINSYAVDGDAVYYISKENQELYKQTNEGTAEAMMPGKKAASIKAVNGNVICILEANELYGLVIFDRKGSILFKTSDIAANASIDGNKLFYQVNENGKADFFSVQLP